MLHFLPPAIRTRIRTEYALRAAIVFLLFVLIALAVLIALFLPSFFFASYNEQTVAGQLSSIDAPAIEALPDPAAVVRQANAVAAAFLENQNGAMTASALIRKVVSLKPAGIAIAGVSVAGEQTDARSVTVSGTAASRSDLTAFEGALSNDGTFSGVVLPVADLIADTNAQFTITMTYAYNPAH